MITQSSLSLIFPSSLHAPTSSFTATAPASPSLPLSSLFSSQDPPIYPCSSHASPQPAPATSYVSYSSSSIYQDRLPHTAHYRYTLKVPSSHISPLLSDFGWKVTSLMWKAQYMRYVSSDIPLYPLYMIFYDHCRHCLRIFLSRSKLAF